jgi:LysM repeat protein
LFVAVGLLAWYVMNLPPATVDPVAVQQTVDAKLAPTLTWIAAQPVSTRLAAGATVTAEAPQVATAVVATNEAVDEASPPAATVTLVPTSTRTPAPPERGAVALLYDAQTGDTWATIAQRYRMTEAELRDYNPVWFECANGLNTACRTQPKAGDDILIPSLTGETVIGRGTTYTIKAGENLFRIGVRTGYTVAALLAANQDKISDPGSVRSGTALYIPRPDQLTTSATPMLRCTLVSDPPLQVGDRGRICLAKGADLGMRTSAGGGQVLTRLKNGTQFTVIGGPECAYYSYAQTAYYWWQVETPAGQRGWLVDGGDKLGDPVYLCRTGEGEAVTNGNDTILRLSAEVVQAITNYWSLWGQPERCPMAWATLSDSFKRNTSGLNQADYLDECATTTVPVTGIVDLNAQTDSVIEIRGRCALVRIRFTYAGAQEMTFGLIQSDVAQDGWQIQVARPLHSEAQAKADAVCGS